MVAGLQLPVMLLFDVFGSAGAVLFWHSGANWVNVGTSCAGKTVMVLTALTILLHWSV